MDISVPNLDRAGITEERYQRFLTRIDKTDGCWRWTACTSGPNGYGVFGVNGRNAYAHRIAFLLWVGELTPEKPFVCHACDNKVCVNPAHLWSGTTQDNIYDKVAKGRSLRGSRHNMAKLTEQDVWDIRSQYPASGCRLVDLAMQYGVCEATIHNIVQRKRWGHVG